MRGGIRQQLRSGDDGGRGGGKPLPYKGEKKRLTERRRGEKIRLTMTVKKTGPR